MRKCLIEKIKIGLVAFGLTNGLSFGTINAQTNSDYKANYENKNFQDSLYQEKEDSILENILEEFLPKYSIYTSYFTESSFDKEKKEWIEKDTFRDFEIPINYLTSNPMDSEESNRINIWESRELAKWLKDLGAKKRDSLKKSILEKEGEITFGYLWNLRQRLDKNYPKEPVRVPGTDSYFIPQKLKGKTISKNALLIFDTIDSTAQDNYKENIKCKKKGDTTLIWDKDKKKIYKFIDK